ncbi:porin family protein [Nafulsella turpanensis]|uniref:porin family protein n=1 Tax=Nafulsella turpanensis TaxID=1265690 RepID=UPI000348ADC1|nr:porin family protein [Nafulsella turpanensis]
MAKLLLLLGCWFLPLGLLAQTSVGLRGGSSLSRVNFDPPTAQEFVNGFEAGLVGRFLNTPHLGLQLELNYSVQGFHLYPATPEAYKREFHYIQLPLTSFLQMGRGRLKFNVQAGAFAAYAFKKTDVLLPAAEAEPRYVYAHQEELPWQYGVLAAAGPAFHFNFGILQLEARFTQHLSDFWEADFSRDDDFDISQQQTITFGAQWLYTFRKKR